MFFLYERDTPKSKEVSEAFRSFYFHNKPLEYPQSLIPFGQLYADGLIGFEYHRFLNMISKYTPVYTYFFTYKGRYSHFVNPDTNQTLGKRKKLNLYHIYTIYMYVYFRSYASR